MRAMKFIYGMALAVLVAGCATQSTSQYYTLLPSAKLANKGISDATVPDKADFAISVSSVSLPQQVDRPQIVLSGYDGSQVTVLNGSLWAAPLSDEIRNALANDLSSQLGAIDVSLREAPASLPLWVIELTVQRFDSIYNQRVVLEATWNLKPRNQANSAVRICRASVHIPVGQGIDALVQGHQQALHYIASAIAAQLSGKPFSAAGDKVILKGCAQA